jgi:hypothetical protein
MSTKNNIGDSRQPGRRSGTEAVVDSHLPADWWAAVILSARKRSAGCS